MLNRIDWALFCVISTERQPLIRSNFRYTARQNQFVLCWCFYYAVRRLFNRISLDLLFLRDCRKNGAGRMELVLDHSVTDKIPGLGVRRALSNSWIFSYRCYCHKKLICFIELGNIFEIGCFWFPSASFTGEWCWNHNCFELLFCHCLFVRVPWRAGCVVCVCPSHLRTHIIRFYDCSTDICVSPNGVAPLPFSIFLVLLQNLFAIPNEKSLTCCLVQYLLLRITNKVLKSLIFKIVDTPLWDS
jgi:hypothetical protein